MIYLGLVAGLFFAKANAAHLRDVEIRSYDCSLQTVQAHNGKCVIEIVVNKQIIELTASPEVSAPWSTFYGDAICHPMSKLHVSISDKSEITSVRDAKGIKVSTKIDYSR